VIGIAVFTGLLTVIGLVMAFVSTLKFDNQYDAIDQCPLCLQIFEW